MKNNLTTQRKPWLDSLRGIAICLVVLSHSIPSGLEKYIYQNISGPIMLPLFFAISGYVFNPKGGNQKAFFVNLLQKIIIPGVSLSLCTLIIGLPKRGIQYLATGMFELLSGDLYWYIPACIIAEIIFFYNLKFCKKHWQTGLTVLICSFIGFVMHHFGIGNFAMLNRAFIVQFFIMVGYSFCCYEDSFKKLKKPVLFIASAVVIVMLVLPYWFWPGRTVDVHMNRYYGSIFNAPYCLTLSALFLLFMMTLGAKLGKISKILAFVGRHTLVTYIFHTYFLTIAKRVLPLSDSSGFLLVGKCLLITAFAIGMCCLGGTIIDRWLPELMGRKRKKKEKV